MLLLLFVLDVVNIVPSDIRYPAGDGPPPCIMNLSAYKLFKNLVPSASNGKTIFSVFSLVFPPITSCKTAVYN